MLQKGRRHLGQGRDGADDPGIGHRAFPHLDQPPRPPRLEAQHDPTVLGPARVQGCAAHGGSGHFLTAAPDCSGRGTPEGIVGCADTARSSNMPRALRACTRAGGGGGGSAPPFYHALDEPCLAGDAQELLGYAH
jgi:hypothetical protein